MMRFLVPALAIVLALAAYWLIRTPSEKASGVKGASSGDGAGAALALANPKTAEDKQGVLPAPVRMRSTPTIEGIVSPVASNESLAESYQSEERDGEQANIHEGVVRGIVEDLAESKVGTARIEELDCRSRHCKLQLASGDQMGLVKLVDALQDERGFLGKAESMMLSRQDDDIVIYLRFSPPK